MTTPLQYTRVLERSIPNPTGLYDDLPHGFNPHEINNTGVFAIAFGILGMVSAFIAGYWFIMMRTKFRHDLIIILIMSNVFRSFWFALFPLVQYGVYGQISSGSAFCQVSGFFLALGIEGSDIAIALIAIHSALYIFRTSKHQRQGLYPYRYYAYATLLLIPPLFGGLAFINKPHGYTSQGSVCYLPTRPLWTLALSWGPRIGIMVLLAVVYPGIYFYVEFRFKNFQKDLVSGFESSPSGSRVKHWFHRRSSSKSDMLPLQELDQRGGTQQNSVGSADTSRTNSSASYVSQMARASSRERGRYFFVPRLPGRANSLNTHSFTPQSPGERQKPPKIQQGSVCTVSSDDLRQLYALEPAQSLTHRPYSPQGYFEPPAIEMRMLNCCLNHNHTAHLSQVRPDLFPQSYFDQLPQQQRPQNSHARERLRSVSVSPLATPRPEDSNSEAQIVGTHHRMRRQLRYLFVYPVVYIVFWIIPFVVHILKSEIEHYFQHQSTVLTYLSILCWVSQATAHCMVFTWIEKPWRHVPGSDGTVLGSFWVRRIRKNQREGKGLKPRENLGTLEALRNTEHMREDRLRSLEEGRARSILEQRKEHRARNWWDQFDDVVGTGGEGTRLSEKAAVKIPKSTTEENSPVDGDAVVDLGEVSASGRVPETEGEREERELERKEMRASQVSPSTSATTRTEMSGALGEEGTSQGSEVQDFAQPRGVG